MTGIIRKQLPLLCLILLLGLFFTTKANAASLSNASDTLSTSRPSLAAPLSANQAASATQVTVVALNNALNDSDDWIASDSAALQFDTGQTANAGLIVATTSAALSNVKTIYFTAGITNAHHQGTTIFTPITAVHTVKFTTNTSVPAGGKLVITFPGTTTAASPSATGFVFNNEAATPTDVKCVDVTAGGATDCTSGAGGSYAYASGVFTITTGATFGAVAGAHQIAIAIGCTTINTSGICTVAAPRVVNPTKGATAEGTADSWRIGIQTQDASSIVLDSATVLAATVEAVQVQGTVEPYITFTIAGINNGTTINSNNSGCTSNTDVTNPGSGNNPTAVFVNLGSLSSSQINISAQDLSVTTNAGGGYTITSTSSGHFINPATGFFLPDANTGNGGNGLTANDTPIPAVVTAGTTFFGIHPCGTDTFTGVTWGTGTTGGGANARYSNPWNSGTSNWYATLASHTGLPSGTIKTTVEYAATASTSVPAGTYFNYFTYVATPIF